MFIMRLDRGKPWSGLEESSYLRFLELREKFPKSFENSVNLATKSAIPKQTLLCLILKDSKVLWTYIMS